MGDMSGSLSEIDEKVMGGAPLLLRWKRELTTPRAGSHLALDAEKMDGDMLIFIQVHVAKTGRADATGHSGSLHLGRGTVVVRAQRAKEFLDGIVAGVFPFSAFNFGNGGLAQARPVGQLHLSDARLAAMPSDDRSNGVHARSIPKSRYARKPSTSGFRNGR